MSPGNKRPPTSPGANQPAARYQPASQQHVFLFVEKLFGAVVGAGISRPSSQPVASHQTSQPAIQPVLLLCLRNSLGGMGVGWAQSSAGHPSCQWPVKQPAIQPPQPAIKPAASQPVLQPASQLASHAARFRFFFLMEKLFFGSRWEVQ